MGERKTQKQFEKEVYDLVGDEYTVLGEYKKSKTKILMKHNKCGHEWEVAPNNFISKRSRCPKCFGSIKKTTEIFINEVKNKYKNEYTVIGEYKDSHAKIKMRHNICGYEWEVKPYSFLNNRKCPKCSKKHSSDLKRRTQEEFENEVYNLTGTEYSVLGKYINALTKIKMKHNSNKCNYHEWEVKPNDFINNSSRCPICNESKGEKKINQYLIDNNILFESQKGYVGLLGVNNGNLSYDFYLKQYNLLIEYQGEYHDGTARSQTEEEFKQQQEHDKRKREYANNHNIKLLEIWYWDFDNIEKILDKELNITKPMEQAV